MGFDRAALEQLAESVGDGAPIEWAAVEAQASDDQRAVIRQLRVLESLAHLHRTLPQAVTELIPTRSLSAPAIGNWGHLALLERLGGGTFGEVYRAWDTQLEREVALKVLRGDAPDSSRLVAEGRLLARIHHENVVAVHGVAANEGRVGLWMELVRGVTLEELVATKGPFSAREAAMTGIDLCRALAAIHGAGLIHRDVKAQNVVREDGGRLVLMDLGTGHDLARTGGTVGFAGTPLYIAPEVFAGEAASVRSDLYSLGVLLYHLVTNEYPVQGASFEGLEQAHATGEAVPLRDRRPDLPTPFVTAIDRALAHDPARRFKSAGEFEAALVRALEAPSAAPTRRFPWQVALAAAVVVLVGWAGFTWRDAATSTPPPAAGAGVPAIRSIAVLPLHNDSGDRAQDFFADGMTDEIISRLGRLGGVNVISRTSTAQFKGMRYNGESQTLPQVAQRLQADAIVEGSLLLTPGDPATGRPEKVRISARLIAAGTDSQIWNQTFEAVASDVLALESQVAKAIAEGIHLHLSATQQGALNTAAQPGQSQNFEAFQLYLRGRSAWNLRTRDGLNQSIDFFRQAIQRDDRYAAAYAGLADAYSLLGTYGLMPLAEASAQAFTAAARAVALDDTLGEAHASLGWAHDDRLEWEAAETSYQRALVLNPSYARAHHWYAAHLMRRGRFDDATRSIRQAMTLDPLSAAVQAQYAAILFLSRRYDEEITFLQQLIATNDTFSRTRRFLGDAYAMKGDFTRALAELRRAEEMGDTSAERLAYEASTLAMAGRRADANRILQQLIARYNGRQDGGPVAIAIVYAALNDRDRAFEWLDRGVQLRDPWIGFLGVDPWFDNLRKDARFATLLARTGLTR